MLTKREISILKETTWADFKLKYSSSVLGFFWSLLNPLLMLATLYLVFSILFKWEIEYYQLFLLLGIIIWNFFSEATTKGMGGILEKAFLIKKIYFRREITIISACLTSFFTLLLNLVVFLIFVLIFKGNFSWHVIYFPFILVELFILALGFSLALGAFYTKFRDLRHIWEVLLSMGFFLTPIVYPISRIPENYLKVYMLNPMARIITTSRDIFISNTISGLWDQTITLILCLAIFFIGYYIFSKRKGHIVEEI
ncbi:MAG: ABC transporter permease [Candidatus Pacearchaeota archaeon]